MKDDKTCNDCIAIAERVKGSVLSILHNKSRFESEGT